ncbi:YdcF family protein [Actinoplanes sp. NBRC 103695]|uniref:YdcF family protein n=1 Tax=Actinoplanes sp. NBRC 103695 TaxID=3032202 RepID=UPI00255458B0|nr:YdcF family protein [Actinoplanes sp. NBRC 103695]
MLGSHDLGVAECAADLYQQGWFPYAVFSGAGNPIRPELFPDGEAVKFRELAIAAGMPPERALLERRASNTGENITLSRTVLAEAGIHPKTVTLVCRPYDQRRAYATCRKLWPQVEPVCASQVIGFDDYLDGIGDDRLLVDMLVGDVQRILEYPSRGFAIAQPVPPAVLDAFTVLRDAGFTSRLLPERG